MKKLTKDHLANLDQYVANRLYSQTGEDGILRHIFDCLGRAHDGFLVDIGAGDGWNLSNTRALLNAGWGGLLIDGNNHHVGVACEFVSDENVNALMDKYHVPAEFDLLSLDIDGQDWWVWRALNRRPKVVVVEVNSNLHADPARTIPRYATWVHDGTSYFGASFSAFVMLGAAKGYTLVHNRGNLNLFFVRNDLLEPGFPITVPYSQSVGQPPDELHREWHYVTTDDLVLVARDLNQPPGELDISRKFINADELMAGAGAEDMAPSPVLLKLEPLRPELPRREFVTGKEGACTVCNTHLVTREYENGDRALGCLACDSRTAKV